MLNEDDIRQINFSLEGEILLALGRDIFSPQQPKINKGEVEGILYLMQLLENEEVKITPSPESPMAYLKSQVETKLENPLSIFTSEQQKQIHSSNEELRIYVKKAIYRFLQEYQGKRSGLKDLENLRSLSDRIERYKEKLFLLEQDLLKEKICFYENFLQRLSTIIERRQNFDNYYMPIFLSLAAVGVIGLGIADFYKVEMGELFTTLLGGSSAGITLVSSLGMLWTYPFGYFKSIWNLVKSLPSEMRTQLENQTPEQVRDSLQQRLNELKQLQEGRLSSTAQMLQTIPSQEVVKDVEIATPSAQLTQRSATRIIAKTATDDEPETPSMKFQ